MLFPLNLTLAHIIIKGKNNC